MNAHAVTSTNENERRRSTRRAVRGLAVAAAIFALLAGYFLHKWRDTTRDPLRTISTQGTWIQAPGNDGYAGFFRHSLTIPSTVTSAWIAIAACDGFEVTVNRNPVIRQYLWRPTRPFQNGLSEKGQRVTAPYPAIGLNFPREYQWSGHDTHRFPVLVDIRPELKAGHNVIGVQIESRRAPAKFMLYGEITLSTGQRIELGSGSLWKSEPVPPGLQETDWTDPSYDDKSWRCAQRAEPPKGSLWRSFDHTVFSEPMTGSWIQHPHASSAEAVVFRHDWNVDCAPQEAWLRLATNRYFDLFVNGTRVSSKDVFAPDLDSGQWILGRHRALDPRERPTLLDPDELDSPFVGHEYEDPPAGDPTHNDFSGLPRTSNDVRHSLNNAELAFAKKHATVRPRELDLTGHVHDWSFPDNVRPQSHGYSRQVGGYVAYDVSRLIHRGGNRIELRLAEPESISATHWPAHIVMDGKARSTTGEWSLTSDGTWQVRSPTSPDWEQPVATTLKSAELALLPRLQYRGKMKSPGDDLRQTSRMQTATARAAALIGAALIGLFFCCTTRDRRAAALRHGSRMLFAVCLGGAGVLIAALLLRISFAERHEAMWFRLPASWCFVLLAACWFGILAGCADLWCRWRSRSGHPPRLSLRTLPRTAAWPMLIALVLLASFVLRAHRLDFQPLDDDEYASTQAILSIAETGLPEYAVEGIWYTRSPLFHYTVGACAALFGPNLWSMRLPSVMFGVATCWLTYLFGSRLLKNPWVGMGAMILIALHPFEIYTGHVIRFYQMQQFMALLTVYFFCKGFVTDQSIRYRYLTVVAFLATVLCQEASCTMGFSLLLGYLVFAEDKSSSANLKLVFLSIIALVVIALDYVVFQSRCMTRLAGVSPNLEAMITPHFWHPFNFLALFIGYSRLHVVGSLFLLAGVPLVCRQRQRNTMALYLILFSSVAMTNLLVTHISLRYQFWLIPLWALLSLEGLRALLQRACAYGLDLRNEPHRHRTLVAGTAFVFFLACVGSLSPWRIAGSYDMKILGDSTGAMRFVGKNLRPGDRVMVTEPHTHAALIETGRVDYDLSVPLLYDFAVLKDGKLIDRNGGAEVIGDLQHLSQVIRRHDRVWIAVNREKLRNRGKNIRWEYPGARIDLFLRRNCELVYKTYLWSVFLWDANTGSFVPFREDRI
jgi:hypothetical protein